MIMMTRMTTTAVCGWNKDQRVFWQNQVFYLLYDDDDDYWCVWVE